MNILVVEDEMDLRELLVYSLAQDHYNVTSVEDGRSAWRKLEEQPFDLVLLDWMLPDMSGIELLRRIRRSPSRKALPVIMVTARDGENDRVHGLDSGADDYVIKPFSMRELRARVRSRLRSSSDEEYEVVDIAGIHLEPQNFKAEVRGVPLVLGPTEFRLLCHFMENPERVFSRSQLLDSVWGPNVFIEERTVDVHIRRLRKALEPHDKAGHIQTVRSAGYRFTRSA